MSKGIERPASQWRRWYGTGRRRSRARLDQRGVQVSAAGRFSRQRPFAGRPIDERWSAGVQICGVSRSTLRSTTVVTATSSVTLPTVRKMSGIISTATSKRERRDRHAQRHRDRRDRADVADLAGQADRAIAHHRADRGRGDHLGQASARSRASARRRRRPRCSSPGPVARNNATAIGRVTSATCSRTPSAARAVSIAGSEASDERVEMATACGAIIASRERRRRDPAGDDRQRIAASVTRMPIDRDQHDIMAEAGEGRAAGARADA